MSKTKAKVSSSENNTVKGTSVLPTDPAPPASPSLLQKLRAKFNGYSLSTQALLWCLLLFVLFLIVTGTVSMLARKLRDGAAPNGMLKRNSSGVLAMPPLPVPTRRFYY